MMVAVAVGWALAGVCLFFLRESFLCQKMSLVTIINSQTISTLWYA